MTNIDNCCGNCKLFDELKKMVNGSCMCKYHHFTTRPETYGCYKIQFNKIENEEDDLE